MEQSCTPGWPRMAAHEARHAAMNLGPPTVSAVREAFLSRPPTLLSPPAATSPLPHDGSSEDRDVAQGVIPAPQSTPQITGQLRREVGLTSLMFISLGSIIGSGWLLGALLAARIAGDRSVLRFEGQRTASLLRRGSRFRTDAGQNPEKPPI